MMLSLVAVSFRYQEKMAAAKGVANFERPTNKNRLSLQLAPNLWPGNEGPTAFLGLLGTPCPARGQEASESGKRHAWEFTSFGAVAIWICRAQRILQAL